MKRIAMIVKNLELHGISTVVMNYSENLEISEYEITIFAGKNINPEYLKVCKEKKINVIELPSKSKNPIKYYISLFNRLRNKEFDICHVHGNSCAMIIELLIAKLNNIDIRIAHCHTTQNGNKIINTMLRPIFKRLYTIACACSEEAGKWIFEKFTVISNGIDINKYLFNIENRNKIRDILKIKENEIVLGNVGRFNEFKNQMFIVDLMEELLKKNKDIKLLLVGDGPKYEELKEYIKNKETKEHIILYGETENVNEIYSAMDIFLFPSKKEGLGIVAIEAQANGLPCIVSEQVPDDIMISDNIVKLPLKKEVWIEKILKMTFQNQKRSLIDIKNLSDFSITENIKLLKKIYTNDAEKEIN